MLRASGPHLVIRLPAAFVLALCGSSLPISAQSDSTAVLSGRVVDASGEPIVGALLRLIGTAHVRETDSTGSFAFDDLPPGTYTMRANYVGYRAAEVNAIELRAGGSHLELISLIANSGPITIRPTLGRPPGPDELAIRAHLRHRALQLGWPSLRDSPTTDGIRELRLEFGASMIYGPRTIVRLVVSADSTWGELREVWWRSAESQGPYQVHPSPARSCTDADTVTTICTLNTQHVDWRALGDSAERIGVWDWFTEVGVRRDFPSLSDQSTLIAEAIIDGVYRSASYYAPDSFPDAQTRALVAVEFLFSREVARALLSGVSP